MEHDDAFLLAALRAAPRRYRLPPLPEEIGTARSGGAETALAFAIEAARVAKQHQSRPQPEVKDLFTSALAELIRRALRCEDGDPAFRALVLRTQVAEVDEHVRLGAQAAADRRAVRLAIDAVAHPGKLRHLEPPALREALSRLHHLATTESWAALQGGIGQLLLAQELRDNEPLHAALQVLLSSPGLERLERGRTLLALDAVQRYQALCEQRGPLAGSRAAFANGRAAARAGADAEETTLEAFRRVAEVLNCRQQGLNRYRVVQGLRTPSGFPGAQDKAKDEWDAAIVRCADAQAPADIVLLAEVKASPAAASADFPRLLRGLHRLAQAHVDTVYTFASTKDVVPITGESLRKLQPPCGHSLPPHVIYCCAAPPESRLPWLSPASKALLLAEPASVAFACQAAQGSSPDPKGLVCVWDAVTTSPRLHSTLHQYETARNVREAMLHPDDLLPALERIDHDHAARL